MPPLLTLQQGNTKLAKGAESAYESVGLFLAPGTTDGVNLCPFATPECLSGCLASAGRAGIFPAIAQARLRKTREFLADRHGFLRRLSREIRLASRRAARRGKRLAVRLNGTSDVRWPESIYVEFPSVQFYDYTKNPQVKTRGNHHVTLSFSGENLPDCLARLREGGNVAVVFDSPDFPDTWHGYPVVSGESSDLRFINPPGHVIALKAKGRARAIAPGGFIQISRKG